jgi:hypothetical protein
MCPPMNLCAHMHVPSYESVCAHACALICSHTPTHLLPPHTHPVAHIHAPTPSLSAPTPSLSAPTSSLSAPTPPRRHSVTLLYSRCRSQVAVMRPYLHTLASIHSRHSERRRPDAPTLSLILTLSLSGGGLYSPWMSRGCVSDIHVTLICALAHILTLSLSGGGFERRRPDAPTLPLILTLSLSGGGFERRAHMPVPSFAPIRPRIAFAPCRSQVAVLSDGGQISFDKVIYTYM